MKIYDTNPQLAGTNASGAAEGVDSSSKGKSARSRGISHERSDEVKLSQLGAQLTTEGEDASREARIAALSALHERGEYKVDAGAVAGRMIDDAITAN